MPAQQGRGLEDDRRLKQGRERTIQTDEDQTVGGLQPGSGRLRPLQDDELLPQIEDLSFASGLRATQPRQQRRKKSWNTDHSVRSLPDWKAIDRLDKIFGSHNRVDRVFGSDKPTAVNSDAEPPELYADELADRIYRANVHPPAARMSQFPPRITDGTVIR
jgi:hypothetical protein